MLLHLPLKGSQDYVWPWRQHKLTFLGLLRDLSEQLGWPCPALEGCGELGCLNMFLLVALETLRERSPLFATVMPNVPAGPGHQLQNRCSWSLSRCS